MNLGFTGTQREMTQEQKEVFYGLVIELSPVQFHHGDCVGADQNAHLQVRKASTATNKKIWIVGHIPLEEKKRAFCQVDEYRTPLDYLVRNHNIVDETQILVATPDDFIEVVRSGTWATIRYARSLQRAIKIIRPDGSIKEENCG